MRALELAQLLLADPEPSRALDVAERVLDEHGCRIDRSTFAGALIAHRGRGGAVFSGHVDVVPPGEAWTRPPFGNAPEQDRLVGRGASDMRGPVACMLACAQTT
ncbi:MAG: M20/M25/M40 family metallo-hydrolase, partial [Candidatus Rokubacteria bacterium]|nr:M20/M25/M40 family metallo-hydrolase [Candidatus Rokubacteria bacterium]